MPMHGHIPGTVKNVHCKRVNLFYLLTTISTVGMVALQSDRFSSCTVDSRIDNTDGRKENKDAAVTEFTCGALENVLNLSSFDACWCGLQLDGVDILKSGTTSLQSCLQAQFVDKPASSSLLFTEKGPCEPCLDQPNECMSCSEVKLWQGKVVDGKIKLVNSTLIDEKLSCQSRQELPMLYKKRKASSRPTSMIGNLIKCQHSAQEVSSSLLKALLFGLGIGVGIKYMLEFSRTEVERLRQRLREAEDMVHDLRQQLESKSENFTTGNVSCSSTIHTTEDPDSHQHTSVSALRSIDANFEYTPAAEDLHFTSRKEGGGPFQSIVREVDSTDLTAKIADLEAELEAELEILQLNLANECSSDKGSPGVSYLELDPLLDVVHGELSSCGLPGMHDIRKDKAHSPHIAVQRANWVVCPRELDRRLRILLQTRQEEHISELEAERKEAEFKLKDEEWKHCACHLTKLSPSNTSGNVYLYCYGCTRINDESENSIGGQHERNSLSNGRHNKSKKNSNCSIHDNEVFQFTLKHMNETTAGKVDDYISSSMGSTIEIETTPATCSKENVIREGSNYCTWEDFLGAIDGSSQHEGHVLLQARCDSQNNALREQEAGQDRNAKFESSVTKSPNENSFGVTQLPVDLGNDYLNITDNAFESSVTKSPNENSFSVTQLTVDLDSDYLNITDNAGCQGIGGNWNVHYDILDDPSSKGESEDKHLKVVYEGSTNPPKFLEQGDDDRSCSFDSLVSMPRPFYHLKNASCTSDTIVKGNIEQSVKTKKLTLSIKDIRRNDKCNIQDNNQWPLGNSSYESAPANTPVGAALAVRDRLFSTPNSCVAQRPTVFSTKNETVKVEKIKFWEVVSKGGSIPAKEFETETLISHEVGTESWSSQGEQLLPISFSCSESDSLSDESSVSDSNEHMGEALIKRIVEKTKSGSSIARDVQTMLAVLEKQETFLASEENALLELDMKNKYTYFREMNRCTYEVGKRKTPPSVVPSEIISLYATPKTKGANSCKRSLFEDPVYMAFKSFSDI